MGPGFTLEGELALGQATGCQTPMPITAYVPHSLLVLPENKLVTVAGSQWHRLGWTGHRGQERTAEATMRRERPLLSQNK